MLLPFSGTVACAASFEWNDVNIGAITGTDTTAKGAVTEARPDGTRPAPPAVSIAGVPSDTAKAQQNIGLVLALAGLVDLPEEIRQYNQVMQNPFIFADPRDIFGKNWAQREPLLFPYHASAQYHPPPSEALYELAVSMTTVEKCAEVLRRYQEALGRVSTIAAPQEKLYNALINAGKIWTPTGQRLLLFPDNPEDCHNQANSLVGIGKLREALALYREALRLRPDYAEAHNNLGNVLSMLGQTQQALEHYREALRLKPDYAGAHSNFGNTLVADGKSAEAIEHFEKALQAWPDSPYIHNNLGEALLILDKISGAITHFQAALRLKPDFPEARANLNKALEARAKEQTAPK